VLLPRFNVYVGERKVVYLYLLLSLGLQFVVWFSRNLYAAAVCTSLVGFFIGVGSLSDLEERHIASVA